MSLQHDSFFEAHAENSGTFPMAGFPSLHDVSESRRERETFRYDPSLIAKTVHNNVDNLVPASELRSSPDAALTSFAQLAVLRLNATRALISLFDSKYQYIVAEATPSLGLSPYADLKDFDSDEHFVLVGTAIPRASGICEIALAIPPSPGPVGTKSVGELPVTVIPDIASDARSSQKSFCHHAPQNRFYAGVPIRSNKGINIGVFCVFDSKPRESLDNNSIRVMQDLSKIIMDHLDAKRNRDEHRRSDRMVRGVGSFVEGKSTISGWRSRPNADSFKDDPSMEGGLNRHQQKLQRETEDPSVDENAAGGATSPARPQPSPLPRRPSSPSQQLFLNRAPPSSASEISVKTLASGASSENIRQAQIQHVFSKAANVIREAIEVESVLFLDASIASFGGLTASEVAQRRSSASNKSTSSSSDEKGDLPSPTFIETDRQDTQCRVLGFSSSTASSIDGRLPSLSHASISDIFLAKLLRRNPEGKIFNFDENGSIQSSDFSGDDATATPTPSDELREVFTATAPPESTRPRPQRRSRRRFSRKSEANILISMFSGARSVAVFPLWDPQKQRWYAGGFVCTKVATRILTREDELSYLRAFGAVIMSEVDHVNTRIVEKSRTDLLNSLSHELRSPLHGIILGTELLHDTPLDAFQGETLVSVENCGRTLLETIDHLLDWSKVNNFIQSTSKRRSSTVSDRGLRGVRDRITIDEGMMSISSNVEIDVLAEEVVESVCAGFSYQRISISQLAKRSNMDPTDADSVRMLDSMQAMEDMASNTNRYGDLQLVLGDVSVTFDINPAASWAFHTQPGAIRRIIMNLLGNSLKYTTKGFVNVNVVQITPKGDSPTKGTHVEIIVADSGRGISQDFLQHHLFTPFAQEDSLSAGTGLGLSLVQQIVAKMGGSIHVWSRVSCGTKVTVRLPLQGAIPASPRASLLKVAGFNEFQAQVAELSSLRVRFLGFPTHNEVRRVEDLSTDVLSEGAIIGNVCQQWLGMEPVEDGGFLPDLVLSTERHLDRLLWERRHGDISTPIVVVCRNALIARQLATTPRFTRKGAVFDFISQPVGPRKLAKVLLLSFRRWTKLQAATIPTPSAFSMTSVEPEPRGFFPAAMNAARSPGESSTDAFPDIRSPGAQDETPSSQVDGNPWDESQPTVPEFKKEIADTYVLPERRREAPAPTLNTVQHPQQKHQPIKKFLLVDDNPLNLKILASFMKRLSHPFDTAADGKQALETFTKSPEQFRCVLMDISMPVMDGFESTRRIRAFEKAQGLSKCQIFALTGLASEQAQKEAFASGIDLFLTKPVRLKELTNILEARGMS